MTSKRKANVTNPVIKYFSFTALTFFLYFLLYGGLMGLLHPIPAPGDSYDYHIPIQQMILNGTFLHPIHVKMVQWYYPGSTEILNALFLALHVPLTLSNIAAIFFLAVMLWKLCYRVLEDYYLSLFVALVIVTQHAFIRWLNAVSIDIWMAGFFVYLLFLLFGELNRDRLYTLLGFSSGMVLGSKYTGVGIVAIMGILFGKKILSSLTPKRLFLFIIPFLVFGISWYIRNFLIVGNPIYPLPLFSLPSTSLFQDSILNQLFDHPILLMNAFIAEYKLYSLIILGSLFYGIYKLLQHDRTNQLTLFILGSLLNILFLFYPTSSQPWIMVSSFRYSYPFALVIILWFYTLIKGHKGLPYLLLFSLLNLSVVSSFSYSPKLLFPTVVVSIFMIIAIEKKKDFVRRFLIQ